MAAHAQALQYFAAWNGFAGRNSDLFTLVARAEEVVAAADAGWPGERGGGVRGDSGGRREASASGLARNWR